MYRCSCKWKSLEIIPICHLTRKEPAQIDQEPKCDRDVALYGFVRGANLNPSNEVHLPGVGDFSPSEISLLPDPCPLPKTIKKRSLNQKERVLYAPLTGYGGLLYDKDAVYIDLESNQVRVSQCN